MGLSNTHLYRYDFAKREAEIRETLLEAHRPESRDDIGFAPIGWDEPYRVIISEDPIRLDSGDTNFFAYVANNPVNLRDPDGEAISLPIVIGVPVLLTGCLAVPECRKYVQCFFAYLADLAGCACKGLSPSGDEEQFLRCVRRANLKFRVCIRWGRYEVH